MEKRSFLETNAQVGRFSNLPLNSLISIDKFGYTGSIETYVVHPEAKLLRVCLWGAGGGGGGCGAVEQVGLGNRGQAGAGGGGGGYTEAWIRDPLSEVSFEYFVAEGGIGGQASSGANAELSWFGNPASLYAEGGNGGAMCCVGESGTFTIEGGDGGFGGGTLADLAITGSKGEKGYITGFNRILARGIVLAGQGGAGPQQSGQSQNMILFIPGTLNGTPGRRYGGGGGGACSLGTGIPATMGGKGADGYLLVFSYR